MAPELGPTGTACTHCLSAAQLGPAVRSAPARVLEETATRPCPQPPGPAWRAGGEGRLPLPPPAVGAAGRGAPGRPGGEQGRSPVHRKPLGTSAGMTGPGALAAIPPAPCRSPRERPRGPAQVSPFTFLRERLPFLRGGPFPAGPSPRPPCPPRRLWGLVGRAEGGSPWVTRSDTPRGRGSCSESCRRAGPGPFPEHSTTQGWLRSPLPPACASRPDLYFIFVCVIFALCIK